MFKERGGGESFWESPSFTFMGSLLANPVDVSLLSRLKVIFLIFHTSLPPCSSLSHGCFGKSLKKGSPSAVRWANSFFPHWEHITAFFLESMGVALRYDVIFFLRNELYFHAVFHIFDSAQMSNSWTRIRTWKWYECGKTKTTLFAHELSSDQGCIRNIHGGTKPPWENICGVSQQRSYSYPARSKFFESDSPYPPFYLRGFPDLLAGGFLFP